jgi:hypothetical protein
MMPDVVAKADSVIHNVKKKAALNGDIMDKATEEQLRPQILLEAFARTVTKIISQTSAAFVTQALRSSAPTASPDNEQADYNQLDESVVRACIGGNMHHNPLPHTTTTTTTTTTPTTTTTTTTPTTTPPALTAAPPITAAPPSCCGVQKDFMGGQEWSQTIEDDLVRLERSGRLQPADPDDINPTNGQDKSLDHLFAMVGSQECKEKYPALFELLENLEALPFELNKKGFLSTTGQPNALTEPGPMCCAISKIQSNVGRRECIDGLTRGIQNGREVSCVYVVNGGGMALLVRGTGNNVAQGIDGLATDTTVLHALETDVLYAYHSLKTSNEIVQVQATEEVSQCGWFVTMYCHSKA